MITHFWFPEAPCLVSSLCPIDFSVAPAASRLNFSRPMLYHSGFYSEQGFYRWCGVVRQESRTMKSHVNYPELCVLNWSWISRHEEAAERILALDKWLIFVGICIAVGEENAYLPEWSTYRNTMTSFVDETVRARTKGPWIFLTNLYYILLLMPTDNAGTCWKKTWTWTRNLKQRRIAVYFVVTCQVTTGS